MFRRLLVYPKGDPCAKKFLLKIGFLFDLWHFEFSVIFGPFFVGDGIFELEGLLLEFLLLSQFWV